MGIFALQQLRQPEESEMDTTIKLFHAFVKFLSTRLMA
jgi:hypothetical protein